MTDEIPGERLAQETVVAIEQAVDSWVESNESSASRDGDILCIEEQELQEKITLMISLTMINATEN